MVDLTQELHSIKERAGEGCWGGSRAVEILWAIQELPCIVWAHVVGACLNKT